MKKSLYTALAIYSACSTILHGELYSKQGEIFDHASQLKYYSSVFSKYHDYIDYTVSSKSSGQMKIIANSLLKQMCEICNIPADNKGNRNMANSLRDFFRKSTVNIGLIIQRASPELIIALPYISEKYWKNETNLLVLFGSLFETRALEIAAGAKDGRLTKYYDGDTVIHALYYPLNLWLFHANIEELVAQVRNSAKGIIEIAEKGAKKQYKQFIESVVAKLFSNISTSEYISRSYGKYEKYKNSRDINQLKSDIDIETVLDTLGMNMAIGSSVDPSGYRKDITQLFSISVTFLADCVIKMFEDNNLFQKVAERTESNVIKKAALKDIYLANQRSIDGVYTNFLARGVGLTKGIQKKLGDKKLPALKKSPSVSEALKYVDLKLISKDKFTYIRKIIKNITFPIVLGTADAYQNWVIEKNNEDNFNLLNHADFMSILAYMLSSKAYELSIHLKRSVFERMGKGEEIHPQILNIEVEELAKLIIEESVKLVNISGKIYKDIDPRIEYKKLENFINSNAEIDVKSHIKNQRKQYNKGELSNSIANEVDAALYTLPSHISKNKEFKKNVKVIFEYLENTEKEHHKNLRKL